MLCCVVQEKNAQDRWNAAVVTLREIVGLWGVGTSFILTGQPALLQRSCSRQRLHTCLGARALFDERTKRCPRMAVPCAGNLLAPWAAATATGVLRSAYSRVQLPRLRKRRMELLGKLKACAYVPYSALTCGPLHCAARKACSPHAECC